MEALARAGDLRARVAAFDWAKTNLGPMRDWSSSLRWAVDLVLASGFPMSVRWGSDLIMIYNDAYGLLLGDWHPDALGKPLRDIWPEIYRELGPMNEAILLGERGQFFAHDHLWQINRYGAPEDAYFTISYSPIPDASAPNGIGGVLATAFETTERVHHEERLRELHEERLRELHEERLREPHEERLREPHEARLRELTRSGCASFPTSCRASSPSARANAIASGPCPRTCSASPTSTATS
jgi:hypothetical protein